jgi:hypothetical protein
MNNIKETEKDINITATETISEVSKYEIDLILEREIKWQKVKIDTWENLNIADFGFKEGESVIIIDTTNKKWVKQLCHMDSNKNRVNSDMLRLHLIHRRCRSPVVINGNKLRCDKCRLPSVPYNNLELWSFENKSLIRAGDIMGEALVQNSGHSIVLVDLEYENRSKRVS